MKPRPVSQKIYSELCELIPGGVNSPVRACYDVEQLPMVASHGLGDRIFDVDNYAYIDFCGAWGALIHGHAAPQIVNAVQKRAEKGMAFGITTPIEKELAKKIISLMPSIQKIRFVSSGTEATMSAVRLARGFTQRDLIIKFDGNYHGHADSFLVKAGSGVMGLSQSSSAGIPMAIIQHTLSLPYNDSEAFKAALRTAAVRDQLAAVIVEPVAGNMGVVPATKEFLKTLREETKEIGALLILDEVITGFRLSKGGAQALYNIVPDITCLGKIMGGGMAAAAFGGRREIMEMLAPLGPIYQAGTLSGNPLAMEAGLQALQMIEEEGFYESLEKKTALLVEPIKEVIKRKQLSACVQQVGSMFTLFFGVCEVRNREEALQADSKRYAALFRYLFEDGVYIPPAQQEAWFVSAAHTQEHLEYTRDLLLSFLKEQ